MIELSHIHKAYPLKNGERNVVLNDVNLKIEEGRSIAILGLNGAGKSTLMRIIGGAEAPDSGKVIRTSKVSWPIGFSGCFHGSLCVSHLRSGYQGGDGVRGRFCGTGQISGYAGEDILFRYEKQVGFWSFYGHPIRFLSD